MKTIRGVKSFVFASSCSMYGQATGDARTEKDELNPLTAYARSKVAMERELEQLASDEFRVTALRFATACGMSPRLRLDLVLNDFVACAMTTGEITVLSIAAVGVYTLLRLRVGPHGVRRENEEGEE